VDQDDAVWRGVGGEPVRSRGQEGRIMIEGRGPERDDLLSGSRMVLPDRGPTASGRTEGHAVRRRPLRICLVSGEFLGPFRSGGIGTAYSKLAEVLTRAGHDVTCLYTSGRYTHGEPIEHWIESYSRQGVRFVPLPESPIPLSASTHLLAVPHRVYLWLREHDDFDIVHFPEYPGAAYYSLLAQRQGLMLRQTTTVVGLHGSTRWARFANQRIARDDWEIELDFLERRSAELADIAWSPSRYMMDWARKQGWDLRCRHVQPLVVSFEPGGSRATPSRGPIQELVFFARQEVRKGLFVFLDAIDQLVAAGAAHQVDRLVVTILGKSLLIEGQESEEILRARSQSWPWAVQILSDRDRDQAIEYLRGPGRLAVIPSLVENFPNTVLECLAAGVPFIASRVGGIPEQVHPDDVERVCFEPDAPSLAQRLRRALREGQAPARLAFDPEANSRAWVRWHERLRPDATRIGARIEARGAGGGRAEPTVSVCIAHHDRPALLRQALDSILDQERGPLEVIVVDDGGPAPAQVELEDIARAYDFPGRGWLLLRQENRSLAAARNRAAAAACGDYLLFLDDDNVAMPHEIATFARVARQTGADALTCFGDLFDSSHPPRRDTVPGLRWLVSGTNQALGVLFNTFGYSNAMIRRAAFHDVGGYTEDHEGGHEDWELLARLVLGGYRLELIPESLFWYRVMPAGLLGSAPLRRNFLRSLRPHLDRIPEPYHAFFEMCIGQSLVGRGWMISPEPEPAREPVTQSEPEPAPEPEPVTQSEPAEEPGPAPPWPFRYRLADRMNARLKRFPYLHRVSKRSIEGLMEMGWREFVGRSIRWRGSSPVGSAARDGPLSRPALPVPHGANGRPHGRRREPSLRNPS
jgi:glycosyltransferase involved in cell wall biosynthesis